MVREDYQIILTVLRFINIFDREYNGFYHQMFMVMLRMYGVPLIAKRIADNFSKLHDCLVTLYCYSYRWDINNPDAEQMAIIFMLNAILNGAY